MLGAGPAAAQVYKCDTPGGAKVFQQQPCASGTQTQTKSQSDTAYKQPEQVAHCRKFSRKYADWVVNARRDFKRVGGTTDDLQKGLLAKNKFADGGDLMTARASMLLTSQPSEEEITTELYAVCMTETWRGPRSEPAPR